MVLTGTPEDGVFSPENKNGHQGGGLCLPGLFQCHVRMLNPEPQQPFCNHEGMGLEPNISMLRIVELKGGKNVLNTQELWISQCWDRPILGDGKMDVKLPGLSKLFGVKFCVTGTPIRHGAYLLPSVQEGRAHLCSAPIPIALQSCLAQRQMLVVEKWSFYLNYTTGI